MTGGQRGAPESGGVEKGQGLGSTFDRGGRPPCRDGKVLTRVASEEERRLHQPWTFAHGRESCRSYPSDDSGLGWQGPCRYLLLSLICAWVIKGAGLHEGDPRRQPAGTGIGRRTLTRAALLRREHAGRIWTVWGDAPDSCPSADGAPEWAALRGPRIAPPPSGSSRF